MSINTVKAPQLTCYECGKIIKGEAHLHVPPNYLIALGVDFMRSYHPACHVKADNRAYAELHGIKNRP